MRKDVLAALLVISAVGAASATAVARPPASPAGAARQVAACTPAEECAGRLILAGGPPPWAPAHGYRRQHEHDRYEHPEHHVGVPDVGIELGRCNRELIGGILGGVAGGAIGSQVGKGANRTAVTIGGTIVGVLIGGAIGRSMDEADHACVAHALEQAPPGHAVTWDDPDGRHYRVVPRAAYADEQGRFCREYRTTATIGGHSQQLYGTACRDEDGSWRRVS